MSVQGRYLDDKRKELNNIEPPVVISSWHKEEFELEGFDKEAYALVSTSYSKVYLLKESVHNEVLLNEYYYDDDEGMLMSDSAVLGKKGMINLMKETGSRVKSFQVVVRYDLANNAIVNIFSREDGKSYIHNDTIAFKNENDFEVLNREHENAGLIHVWNKEDNVYLYILSHLEEEKQVWILKKYTLSGQDFSGEVLETKTEPSALINVFYDVDEDRIISCL